MTTHHDDSAGNKGLSRRQLLTGSLASAAALGTAGVLGTSSAYAQACATTVAPTYYPLGNFTPDPNIDLHGKVVVVTGGSSGNGRATCNAFVAAGASVVGTSRNVKKVPSLPNFPLLDLDITDPDSIDGFMGKLNQWLGGRKVDILVNNAGRVIFGNILPNNFSDHRISKHYFDQIHLGLETLYFGHIRMTHRILPLMPTSGYARLMYTVSSAAYNTGGTDVVFPIIQTYVSAKRAYLGYPNHLRAVLQMSGSNIQVTTVNPVTMNTSLADDKNIIYTDLTQPGSNGFTDGGNSFRDQLLAIFRQTLANGLDPSFVGNAYVQLARTAAPPPNVLVGSTVEPYATQGGTAYILQQMLAENAQAALPFACGTGS